FLAAKFSRPGRPMVIANESWLRQSNIVSHDRRGARQPATILFVGRMIRLKRIDHLLEAVRRLVGERRDLRVVLAGDGPVREEIERSVRGLGLEARVTFTGWVQPLSPALFRLYDQADVFCLPSYSEGLPLVVLEAMGRGVPVVATAVSGTPEAVEDERSGLLVPRDDVAELTNALRRLLDDPGLWRRCVDGGFEVARRNTFETQRGILAAGINGLAT